MKKLLILLFSILISFNSYGADWIKITSTTKNDFYAKVAKSSIFIKSNGNPINIDNFKEIAIQNSIQVSKFKYKLLLNQMAICLLICLALKQEKSSNLYL